MRFPKWGFLFLLWIGSGCDCARTQSQIQASHVMVATVVATPTLQLPAQAIAGLDASVLMFDAGNFQFDGGCPFQGGCEFDAGMLPISLSDGGLTIGAQTVLFTFFGTRTGDGLTTAPLPVEDAKVRVKLNGSSWDLKPQDGGAHLLTSADDSTVKYESGGTFTFTAIKGTEEYVGAVSNAPTPERIQQLHPAAGYIQMPAGTELVLTRPDPEPNQTRLLGFVSVVPVSSDGKQGKMTYTNVPKNALGFLKLVAAPSDWKSTLVKIPGTAFPDRNRNYLVLFQAAQVGFSDSPNLFIGSAMIVGVADVGVVKTSP